MVLRRRFSIIISIFVCLFAVIALTSCGGDSSKPEDNSIILTVDNIENYVTLSVKPNCTQSSYNSVGCGKCQFGAYTTVTGIAGYTYNNVKITVKAAFSYLGESDSVTMIINCNVGGNGSDSAVSSRYIYDFKRAWMTQNAHYEIVSVTGTCTKD